MENLSVTTIQTDLYWENIEANLEMFEGYFEKIANTALIILPEMFTTGFTMNASKLAEAMDGKTIKWLQYHAQKKKSVITGSIIIHENDYYFNRLIWMRPDGTYDHYDKRHLFTLAKEHHYYTAGSQRLIVDLKGWRICPLICYDLRFPVWSRCQDDYDLLIYVANWPKKRIDAWKTLLHARAIENQAYVIGVNRIGIDHDGHAYSGESTVITPGEEGILYQISERPDIKTHILDFESLKTVWSKWPFLADRDQFIII